jgi:membrane protease YdiL (CAAX protease family)
VLKKLFASSVRWRVKVIWWAAALLLFPVLLFMIFYSLSFLLPNYSPASLVGLGIAAGLIGGYFEELGWTGFATPVMLQRFGMFKTGLVLGFIHATWHFFSDYLGSAGFYNNLYVVHFLLWILALVSLRFIIIFIYHHTRSLLLAQLTHASFTGSQIIFTPAGLTSTETVIWYALFTAVLVVLAVVIIMRERKSESSGLQAAGRKLVLHNNL